jgi:predicted negative regulator of RcsB-dependent stress response
MRTRSSIKFIVTASILAITAFGAGGCSSVVRNDVTGSVATNVAPQTDADWRKAVEIYGERYRADPKDAEAALRYGQALRATGQRAQASAVLEQAAIVNPSNRALVAAYGRALVDNGKYQQGFDTLSRAHTPENPDWHILSVQGTALDRLGRHEDARRYYGNALKIRLTSRRSCPTSACPTFSPNSSPKPRKCCAGHRTARRPTCASARTLPLRSDCRAAWARPKPSSPPACRRTRLPTASAS